MCKILVFLSIALLGSSLSASPIPKDTRQLVVAVAADWNSTSAQLWMLQRSEVEKPWQLAAGPIPTKLGRTGLIWGRGLHTPPQGATLKREGDGKTPCGAFAIGQAYGTLDPQTVRRHSNMRYHHIGPSDLWVEDENSEYYNRHIRLPDGRSPNTEWEKKQQMRLNDNAHKLKLFIAHNAHPNIVRGAGSAIFIHIWRDNGGRPTAGCTAMPEPSLRQLIAWTDPAAKPVFVILPRSEYARLARSWGLPRLF